MRLMRKYIITILFAALFLLGTHAAFAGGLDVRDTKIFHSEKWDLLLLYPDTWNYIEEFGDNVPVILNPPPDVEPDGFVMVYFLGESVVENLDELAEEFEGEYLKSYETYEILSVDEGKTKEGYATLDYHYTFVDHGMDYISDSRLLITEEDVSWMILFDRPPDCSEAVKKDAMKVIKSVIFSAAEYLANGE